MAIVKVKTFRSIQVDDACAQLDPISVTQDLTYVKKEQKLINARPTPIVHPGQAELNVTQKQNPIDALNVRQTLIAQLQLSQSVFVPPGNAAHVLPMVNVVDFPQTHPLLYGARKTIKTFSKTNVLNVCRMLNAQM